MNDYEVDGLGEDGLFYEESHDIDETDSEEADDSGDEESSSDAHDSGEKHGSENEDKSSKKHEYSEEHECGEEHNSEEKEEVYDFNIKLSEERGPDMDDLVTKEEKYALRKKYGIEGGYQGLRPVLGSYDMEQIKRGFETYEDYQRREYSLKASFCADEERMLRTKRSFKRTMQKAIGGIEKLSQLATNYDDLIKYLNHPDILDKVSKIRKLLEEVPEEKVQEIIEKLYEDGEISEKEYEYLIENFTKKGGRRS
jgi:hypothetical protein